VNCVHAAGTAEAPAGLVASDERGGDGEEVQALPRWQVMLAREVLALGLVPVEESIGPLAYYTAHGRQALATALEFATDELVTHLDEIVEQISSSELRSGGVAAAVRAVEHVRRVAIVTPQDTASPTWMILPALDGAAICSEADPRRMRLTPAHRGVEVRVGAGGCPEGGTLFRSYGSLDDDSIKLHGVVALGNPLACVRLPGATHCAISQATAIQNLGLWDIVNYFRDASAHGPTWHSIPDPNAVDLSTIAMARYIVTSGRPLPLYTPEAAQAMATRSAIIVHSRGGGLCVTENFTVLERSRWRRRSQRIFHDAECRLMSYW